MRVRFLVTDAGDRPARCTIDLRIHFVKASGTISGKVFDVRQVELRPGEAVELASRSPSPGTVPAPTTPASTGSTS